MRPRSTVALFATCRSFYRISEHIAFTYHCFNYYAHTVTYLLWQRHTEKGSR